MRGQQASAGELIANNAIHAGFISGKGGLAPSYFSKRCLMEPGLIFVNNQLLGQCEGQFLLETIRLSLKWLWQDLLQAVSGFMQDRLFSRGLFQTYFQW